MNCSNEEGKKFTRRITDFNMNMSYKDYVSIMMENNSFLNNNSPKNNSSNLINCNDNICNCEKEMKDFCAQNRVTMPAYIVNDDNSKKRKIG